MKNLFRKTLTDNSQIKIVYILLDGVGDLPHPDIENKTPLQAAKTPNMDKLAKNGKMGEVISVGKGIAPESDIAVFNMLGYKFHHADYAGRGVIEAIGTGIDFKDGDLALRGNFSTLDETDSAGLSAELVKEFTEKSLKILKDSEINKKRRSQGKKLLNSIVLRDAGNKYPRVETCLLYTSPSPRDVEESRMPSSA